MEVEEMNFEIGGATMAIRQNMSYTDRPTLIFLHDSLGCIQLWRDFPDQLAKAVDCNYVIYDRHGHGSSKQKAPLVERGINYMEVEAHLLNELIHAQSIEYPIYFGHSDGGSIALIAGAQRPELPLGIITEGAHIFVEEVTLVGIRQVQKIYHTTDLKERLSKYHGEKTEDVFQAWTRSWLRPDFRDWSIVSNLADIACPVLAVQGENDEFGSIKQVMGIVNGVSGRSESFIVPNVGHTPHKVSYESTLNRVSQFIAKVLLNE